MKVYYSGEFEQHLPFERSGQKLSIEKTFEWNGFEWRIPAIYSCTKGLVIDLCKKIPAEDVITYYDKWTDERRFSNLSNEEFEEMKQDNPFCLAIHPEAVINQKTVHIIERMSALGWQNYRQDIIKDVSERLMDTYNCDRAYGWLFSRICFPWPFKKKSKLKSLTFIMAAEKEPHICERHFVTRPECSPFQIDFSHPVTGERYILNVTGCHQNMLSQDILPPSAPGDNSEWRFPNQYQTLNYYFNPAIKTDSFLLKDCAKSDQPEMLKTNVTEPKNSSCCAIGIIGGADEPVPILAGGDKEEFEPKTVCSSLHFEPMAEVEWSIHVYMAPVSPITLELI